MTRAKESSTIGLVAGQLIVFLVLAGWSNPSGAPVLPKNCPAKCNAECTGQGAECRARVEVLCAGTTPEAGDDKISVCRGYYEACNAGESSCAGGCGPQFGNCDEEEDEDQDDDKDKEDQDDEQSEEEQDAPGDDAGDGSGGDGQASGGAGSGSGGGSGGGSGSGSGGGSGSGSGSGSGGGTGGGSGGDKDSGPPDLPGWPPGSGGGGGGGSKKGDTNICVGDGACSVGDPHLVSLDRVRFDFQGAGEYHFALSDNNEIDIQVRYSPAHASNSVSLTTGIAARVGPRRMTVDPKRRKPVEINGEPVSVRSGLSNILNHESGIVILRQGNIFRVDMTDGVRISFAEWGTYLDFGVVSSEQSVRGLAGSNDGNWDNEFTTRDGVTISSDKYQLSYEQLYRQFGDSWRITQEESLFDYADGESTITYSLLDFPTKHLDLAAMGDADRQRAEAICRDAGVAPGPGFDNCVYDVGFTNDPIYAEGYVDRPAHLTATLDAPQTAAAGTTLTVQWTGPANEGDHIALASLDQAGNSYKTRSDLNESDEVELQVPGIPGDYELRYILQADRAIVASIPLTVTPVVATLDAPARVAAGAKIRVRWTGPANEGDHITLASLDQAGNSYKTRSDLNESDEVELQVPGIPDDYELRYILQADRIIVASIPLTVTPVVATLDAPARVSAGETVVVRWEGPGNQQDYIVMALPDMGPTSYSNFKIVGAESDTVELRAPDQPGDYVLRYVLSNDRQTIAEIPITVE